MAGADMLFHGVTGFARGPLLPEIILHTFSTALGLLLMAGLLTPVTGALVSVAALVIGLSGSGDPWHWLLLATSGAALALLGPGTRSVDARLFRWKRIEIPPRKGQPPF